MQMLRKFITENKFTFSPGTRNANVVSTIGYAQHLKMTKEQLEEELKSEIENDSFIEDEIDRLWGYCASNNYAKYWDEKLSAKG